MKLWLCLVVPEEKRQHEGNEGYPDDPSKGYPFDSTVANHNRLTEGDLVLLSDRETLLGVGRVGRIASRTGRKLRRRCPRCRFTGFKARKLRRPRYRCPQCRFEFDDPLHEEIDVTTYFASFEGSWTPSHVPISHDELRALCEGPLSQQSIRPMKTEETQRALTAWGMTSALAPSEGSTTANAQEGDQTSPEELFIRQVISPRAADQGMIFEYERRRLIELHAMKCVRARLEAEGWKVRDISAHESCDFACQRNGKTLFVEVKGTTSAGMSILLTANEVAFARTHEGCYALAVVSEIHVGDDLKEDGVSGGKLRLEMGWQPQEDNLQVVAYRYRF